MPQLGRTYRLDLAICSCPRYRVHGPPRGVRCFSEVARSVRQQRHRFRAGGGRHQPCSDSPRQGYRSDLGSRQEGKREAKCVGVADGTVYLGVSPLSICVVFSRLELHGCQADDSRGALVVELPLHERNSQVDEEPARAFTAPEVFLPAGGA